MSDKEVLDGVEKTLDVIEKRLDGVEDMSNWFYFDKATKIKFGIGLGMIGAGIAIAAGTTGWLICKRKLSVEFNDHLEEQIRLTKEHYAKRAKVDVYSTPETAAAELGVPVVAPDEGADSEKTHQDAVSAMRDYRAMSDNSDDESPTAPDVKVEVNVFTEAANAALWDQDKEDAWRNGLKPGIPYIISNDEFLQSERDYNQTTLTYYAGDGVLADSTDDPIELIDMAVGEGNLRFGYGSEDSRTVYIRNDRLEQDFEVVQSDGKFAHEVLGLQHSDERGSRQRDRHERRNQTRKFRDGDD